MNRSKLINFKLQENRYVAHPIKYLQVLQFLKNKPTTLLENRKMQNNCLHRVYIEASYKLVHELVHQLTGLVNQLVIFGYMSISTDEK